MIRVISEPVCRDAEGTEGGEAALAEGDRRELGDVDAHGQVSLREVEATPKDRVEGGARPGAPSRGGEEVVTGRGPVMPAAAGGGGWPRRL